MKEGRLMKEGMCLIYRKLERGLYKISVSSAPVDFREACDWEKAWG